MSKKVLIGGIGNVLLGDDAVGPYVVRLLESQYSFPDGVEIVDLGTPALDLTHRIAGLHAVILIDCVATDEYPPGTILVYDKAEILRVQPAQRLDTHSPALSECLMTAEMLGTSPEQVMLIGVVGLSFHPGSRMSAAVENSAAKVIGAILAELHQLGISYRGQESPLAPSIWWSDSTIITHEREETTGHPSAEELRLCV